MKADNARLIHQHISAPLVDVPSRFFRELSTAYFFHISPPSGGSPKIQESGVQHAVCVIQRAFFIHKQGPSKICFLNISPCEKVLFKGDNDDFHPQTVQLFLVAPQLRQVSPARQSSEVTVEDQQQPVSGIVLHAVWFAVDIPKKKRNRFFPYHIHCIQFSLFITQQRLYRIVRQLVRVSRIIHGMPLCRLYRRRAEVL